MDILTQNLTELSAFIDEIVLPFKEVANLHLANIKEFIPLSKNSIAIVYTYAAQGSLKDYRKVSRFDESMITEVQKMLKNVLMHWEGQYRLLSDEQILIHKGRPLLKYPPFPNSMLR
jgi:hypothetical protein